jgi:hypothetical protein
MSLISKINIEGVPVGGFLAAVIGLLWPTEDQSEANWLAIKKYAEAMVNTAIDKARIDTLNKRLEGLRSVARAYANTSYSSPAKGGSLTSFMHELRLFEPDFWDEKNPEKMFPLFTTFGTLWLSALGEYAYKFKEVYKADDPDAVKNLAQFHANLARYTDAAQRMFDNLERWRFRKFELTEWQTHTATQSQSVWTFTDTYDSGNGKPFFQRKSGAEDWGHSNHARGAQRAMEIVAADHIAVIRAGFMEDLQNILATAQLWKFLDPKAPRPVPFPIVSSDGPWGEWQYRGPSFQDKPAALESRITHIKIRAGGGSGGVVEFLELFYDGKSGGGHGNPSGGSLTELALEPDEFVTHVDGRMGQFLDRIVFSTNKTRSIAGGNTSGGQDFGSTGHASWSDVSLHAVGGWNDQRRLTGLKLLWKHTTVIAPYTARYKKAGKPLSPFVNVLFKGETGTYLSNLVNEYSGRAASNEFFARHGTSPVVHQIHLADASGGDPGKTLSHGQNVRIWTSQDEAKKYPYLGKFAASTCYYYSEGYDEQLWTIEKVIPSDGPVIAGEWIYFRNQQECSFLAPTDEGYVGSLSSPYAWEVTPA